MSDQITMERDITRRKHGGNENSHAAFLKALESMPESRANVLRAVKHAGKYGITRKELASRWRSELHKISGRFSELLRDGFIHETGRRNGSGVCVFGKGAK